MDYSNHWSHQSTDNKDFMMFNGYQHHHPETYVQPSDTEYLQSHKDYTPSYEHDPRADSYAHYYHTTPMDSHFTPDSYSSSCHDPAQISQAYPQQLYAPESYPSGDRSTVPDAHAHYPYSYFSPESEAYSTHSTPPSDFQTPVHSPRSSSHSSPNSSSVSGHFARENRRENKEIWGTLPNQYVPIAVQSRVLPDIRQEDHADKGWKEWNWGCNWKGNDDVPAAPSLMNTSPYVFTDARGRAHSRRHGQWSR